MSAPAHGPSECGAPLAECVGPAPLELFASEPLELIASAPLEPAGPAPLEVGYLPWGMGSAPLELAAQAGGQPTVFWSWARRSVRATGVIFLVQPVKVSCSDWMAWSCLLERDDVPTWRADTSCCSPWVTRSAGVTVGWVMWWCQNSVVSDITVDLESLRVTTWHR